MKKRCLSILAVLMILSVFMTGCGKKDEEIKEYSGDDTTVTTVVTTVGTRPANDVPVTENIDETASDTEDSTETAALMPVIETVTSSVEWANLAEVTDESILTEFFQLDKNNENYKDILVMQCPMSAVTAEIIIIEAVDGKIDDVKADLTARQDKLINVDSFYPDAKAIAENSIVGTHNNVAYFIAGENAAESEGILTEELSKLGY